MCKEADARSAIAALLRLCRSCIVLLCLALGASATVHAQSDAQTVLTLRGDETPETIRKLVDALSAGGRKVDVRVHGQRVASQSNVPVSQVPAASAIAGGSRLEAFWDNFLSGVDYGAVRIPSVVGLPADWSRVWASNRNDTGGLSSGLRLALVFGLGGAAAAAWRAASAGWFSRRRVPKGPEPTPRFIASLFGAIQDVTTMLVGLGTLRLAKPALLPLPDLAATTAEVLTQPLVITAAYLIVGRFLLAPGAPERRLVALPRARRNFRLLAVYAVLGPAVLAATAIGLQIATDKASVAGLFMLNSLVITLFKVWWFWDARNDLAALVRSLSPQPGPGMRLLARLTPWLFIASAVAIWMIGRAAAMMIDGQRWGEAAGVTQFIVVLVPVCAVGVTSLIGCWRASHAAETETTPLSGAIGRTMQAAAGALIWIGAAYVMMQLWAEFFVDTGSADVVAFRRQVGAVALLAFGGWVALVFLRGFFDAYAPRPRSALPGDDDAVDEDQVPSRLATVLPVIRGVVLGSVLGLTGLVVLSRLGVDIGPLLAGFGILGLAISFGSQALVRDIVSGLFFMLEDAFRVGEYVDTGRLKGTVEKISLRSMQLRHQSGQIHTVPFGQIASLTNASRDWATIKFNVRLDHSADIEKARKTIKKTGLALLDDPEYGPHFIAQLKLQGVADITDSAIVLRLKFTAKPNHASTLQRECLKRIYRTFVEAGIPFASNAVTVRGGEPGVSAGAAAAIAAVPPPSPLAPAAG